MVMALIDTRTMEAGMGRAQLVNKIPQLLAEKGMSERDFLAECVRQGLSPMTVARLLKPDYINTNVETLAKVAAALKLNSISEVMDFGKPE